MTTPRAIPSTNLLILVLLAAAQMLGAVPVTQAKRFGGMRSSRALRSLASRTSLSGGGRHRRRARPAPKNCEEWNGQLDATEFRIGQAQEIVDLCEREANRPPSLTQEGWLDWFYASSDDGCQSARGSLKTLSKRKADLMTKAPSPDCIRMTHTVG